jgi:hypothetical protein
VLPVPAEFGSGTVGPSASYVFLDEWRTLRHLNRPHRPMGANYTPRPMLVNTHARQLG